MVYGKGPYTRRLYSFATHIHTNRKILPHHTSCTAPYIDTVVASHPSELHAERFSNYLVAISLKLCELVKAECIIYNICELPWPLHGAVHGRLRTTLGTTPTAAHTYVEAEHPLSWQQHDRSSGRSGALARCGLGVGGVGARLADSAANQNQHPKPCHVETNDCRGGRRQPASHLPASQPYNLHLLAGPCAGRKIMLANRRSIRPRRSDKDHSVLATADDRALLAELVVHAREALLPLADLELDCAPQPTSGEVRRKTWPSSRQDKRASKW